MRAPACTLSGVLNAIGLSTPGLCRLLQARRDYQSMLSERLCTGSGQLTIASGALVSCAALFEQLLPHAGGTAAAEFLRENADGTSAAIAIYEQALAAAPVEVIHHLDNGDHLFHREYMILA